MIRKKILHEMKMIIKHFFQVHETIGIPFRGFLLEGPPGNGKTELVRQLARIVAQELNYHSIKVEFLFVDSSNIAAAKWGDAEQNLKNIFRILCDNEKKLIILIDDIDCLMMKRGMDIAKEWHYSINSIIFHELDKIDASEKIVIATTNQSDLIDDALRSRLYHYSIPPYSKEELLEIADRILRDRERTLENLNSERRTYILKTIKDQIETKEKNNESFNMRDIEHIIVKTYLEMILTNGDIKS